MFADILWAWLAVKEKTVKPVSYNEYKRIIEVLILPPFGDKKLSDMTREIIQRFLFEFTDKGKLCTADRLYTILKAAFDLAVVDHKIESPMDSIILPKYKPKKGKAFTRDEERKLIDICSTLKNRVIASGFLLLLYTGVRIGELKSLRIIDDNWLECKCGKIRMGEEVKYRRIPITPRLRAVWPLIDFEKGISGRGGTFEDKIRTLFPNHHLHELRYTFITRAKECGINPELIMAWDGHSFDKDVKSSVIDRGYTDYSEDYEISEAKKFDYTP